MDIHYILEYNEKKGVFHYRDAKFDTDTDGYLMVPDHIYPETVYDLFCKWVERKHPAVGSWETPSHKPPYPTYAPVRKEFEDFYYLYSLIAERLVRSEWT